MKNTVLKFGGYGLILGAVIFGLALTFGGGLSYTTQEIIGYGSMVASLSFVYFGIKHFRDQVNDGKVTFGKALLIGVLISAFVGLGVGIVDYLYTTVINPNFAEDYLAKTLEGYETLYSGEELTAKKAELTKQMKDFGGSGFMAALMFFTVLIIGFIISLISGLILQKK
ncbi:MULTISPECIES: DUF4199 domain-containing protein [Winogradskyella]|uniref:DUF4199 domain-containing protein n=1 Tax=Winogradskyella marincola TaxID=3037795 RepID=A0ABT6G217_9FLAO|nr:DUF4199 domain-containing protein [Winogradskyella sp. YYF002]MDG4716078.1 DUF4199 domain-containing protein [Winogradskyella sp. YYF002]